MDINTSLTIRRSQKDKEAGVLHFQVRDEDSRCIFLQFTISDSELINALRGTAEVNCEATVTGLEKVGKKLVYEHFSFPIPSDGLHRKEAALELLDSATPEGWIADRYFDSQNSFTQKDGVTYANTMIRKWIDKE